jgi:transcriptional regulator with XRE-family HTH domain
MPRKGVRGFSSSLLRKARADAGLRPDELARLLGVSRQAVTTWESGKSKPSPGMLRALADALRVRPADLAPIREEDLRMGDLRAHAGLTQIEVADALAVNPTMIGDMERGFRPVSEDQVTTLTALYGLTDDRVRAVWERTYDAVTTRLKPR